MKWLFTAQNLVSEKLRPSKNHKLWASCLSLKIQICNQNKFQWCKWQTLSHRSGMGLHQLLISVTTRSQDQSPINAIESSQLRKLSTNLVIKSWGLTSVVKEEEFSQPFSSPMSGMSMETRLIWDKIHLRFIALIQFSSSTIDHRPSSLLLLVLNWPQGKWNI